MSKVFIEESTLTSIGDAIRAKTGKSDLIAPGDMPEEIEAIETGGGGADLPEEAFLITGDCRYRFANGGWDWFVENYGNRVTTKDLTNALSMFESSQTEEIPFELNFDSTKDYHDVATMFYSAASLISIPKINNCKPYETKSMFSGCKSLRYLPEDIADWFDWSYIESQTNSSRGARSGMFMNCYSLRKMPSDFLNHANKANSTSYSYFSSCFSSCWSLDELTDLPIPYTATWTTNVFSSTFSKCGRLKNLTFAMPNGQPYVMNWNTQTINLSSYIGYGSVTSNPVNENSGITADKKVIDDATYQALKDDPDWFTWDVNYSRYNHDSAVATINSLPDTSAYLATAGGTNTIRFNGKSGSATDGGAINTLTEEEIAVATAKGWTVSIS